jgi:hypothetical protein
MFLVYPYMIIMMISICYLWMFHELIHACMNAKIGKVMPLLSFKFNAQIQGGFLCFSMNCQDFISKVKSHLCCHQLPKRGRLKVHLGPQLILVIENNQNKNLIISMSMKQGFRYQKGEKEKRPPQFLSIQMKGH